MFRSLVSFNHQAEGIWSFPMRDPLTHKTHAQQEIRREPKNNRPCVLPVSSSNLCDSIRLRRMAFRCPFGFVEGNPASSGLRTRATNLTVSRGCQRWTLGPYSAYFVVLRGFEALCFLLVGDLMLGGLMYNGTPKEGPQTGPLQQHWRLH